MTFADGKVEWRKIQIDNEERDIHDAARMRFDQIRAAALECGLHYELWTSSALQKRAHPLRIDA